MKVVLSVISVIMLWSCSQPPVVQSLVPGNWKDWKRTSLVPLDYPIPGHMDNYREIFINLLGEKVSTNLVDGKVKWDYPAGTIIAKAIYAKDGPREEADILTVMVKNPGDSRSQGGWVWLMKDLKTGNESVLSQDFCLNCHADANLAHPYGQGNPDQEFRDYVFFPYSPAP